MSQAFQRITSFFVAAVIPFFLLMTAIRILFTPVFLQIEYRMPGFPPDEYGFSLDDRLHWSRVSLEYMYNAAGIEYLADQQLQDGSPLYSQRELSHMEDVKVVFQRMQIAWWVTVVVLIVIGVLTWRVHSIKAFLRGLGYGGRLTIALIVLILATVAISFNALFTAFHRLFFTGDTWLFQYSDNLIRLFPMRFWQDGFIAMGLVTLAGAGLLIWVEWRYARDNA